MTIRLYKWEIVDTIAEYAEAVAIAESKEAAIDVICNSIDDADFCNELRQELTENEPDVYAAPYGFYSESPT